jgi:hypothetical protein
MNCVVNEFQECVKPLKRSAVKIRVYPRRLGQRRVNLDEALIDLIKLRARLLLLQGPI